MVSSEMASVMPQKRGEGFLKEIGSERGYSTVRGKSMYNANMWVFDKNLGFVNTSNILFRKLNSV